WTRGIAAAHVAFRTFILRRRPGCIFSQVNSPPRLFPCLRFAVHLAMPNAKLGAKVDRYSFLVRILHSLLHTGLARRTNIPITLIMRARGAPAGPCSARGPIGATSVLLAAPVSAQVRRGSCKSVTYMSEA